MPGFRARNEGEPVRMGDAITLQSVKGPSMYMHCNTADDPKMPFKLPGPDVTIDDDVRPVPFTAHFHVVAVCRAEWWHCLSKLLLHTRAEIPTTARPHCFDLHTYVLYRTLVLISCG